MACELSETTIKNTKKAIKLSKANNELNKKVSEDLKEISNKNIEIKSLKETVSVNENQINNLTKKNKLQKELENKKELEFKPLIHKAKIYDLIVQKTQYQNALIQIDEAIHNEEVLISKLLKGV